MVLENFQKFISQERYIGISILGADCLYFNLVFKRQLVSLSKFDFHENRNYTFSRKNMKIVFQMMKDISKKSKN